MALHYTEGPVLFVTATAKSVIPDGRNVRRQHRTQQAAAHQPSTNTEDGYFAVLNFRSKRRKAANRTKRLRKDRRMTAHDDRGVVWNPELTQNIKRSFCGLPTSLALHNVWPLAVNPSKVLALATFHIRRVTAMTLSKDSDRLPEVLRCRQWSYVSVALERIGQCGCLDSALSCVTAKLMQMIGERISYYFVLSNYANALQSLQTALHYPSRYNTRDLQTTSQLLAIYEMLESLDRAAWAQHLAGVKSLSQSEAVVLPAELDSPAGCSFALLPMFTDALLSDNYSVFKLHNWRTPLQSLVQKTRGGKKFMSCLFSLSELLLDAELSCKSGEIDASTRYALLDRAHALKARLRTELLDRKSYLYRESPEQMPFDKVGLSLAGLVSLDRLVALLRPVQVRSYEAAEDKTRELSIQLLQLELRDTDAYPATDLMSAFQLSPP